MRQLIPIFVFIFFTSCGTKKDDLIGIWETEDGEETLFIHKRHDDLMIDYSTSRTINGYRLTIFSSEATFDDNKFTLKNTFYINRAWPKTIMYKNNQLVYQDKIFIQNKERTKDYLKSVKEQEERAAKDKSENDKSSLYISNPSPINVGRASDLLKIQSHNELELKFGKNKVEKLIGAMSGKTEIPFGSVLNEGEVNQVIFIWKDNSYSNLVSLFISPGIQNKKYVVPDWQIDGDIRIGMTVDELIKLNGTKIDFMGLGNFDKSGMVLSYNNGQLSNYNVFPEVMSMGGIPVDILNKFMGYKKISSDNKYFDKLDLRVQSLWLLNTTPVENNQSSTTTSSETPQEFLEDYLKYDSHDDLVDIFGEENVIKKKGMTEGGETEYTSILFPNSKKRLSFVWNNADYSNLKLLVDGIGITGNTKPTPSYYKTKDGIALNLPLSNLQTINEKPVSFYGFEWDDGGYVTNWNNGKLDKNNLVVVLSYKGNISADKADKFLGEVVLTSNDKNLSSSGLNIFVKTIYLLKN